VLWSGNNASEFTSSFSSDLLWYRLFPNSTYPLGILLSALIVSLPLLAILAVRLADRQAPLHFIRTLGLGAILLVLFAGGLVVSVKIGGGSNLHNLDAYLALLMVMAAYAFFRRIQGEPQNEGTSEESTQAGAGKGWQSQRVQAVILTAAALVPLYSAILSGGPPDRLSPEVTQKTLTVLKKLVPSGPGAGEVLFLGNRQLITFGDLPGIKLVPEYERVFLMEMAMAGNPDYLGRFHQELKDHRFAMIVSEPIFVQYKNSDEIFGEENNAWVTQVSKYVWCYYEPQRLLRDVRVQLLVPREEPGENCP
jgi:hypothetical protein